MTPQTHPIPRRTMVRARVHDWLHALLPTVVKRPYGARPDDRLYLDRSQLLELALDLSWAIGVTRASLDAQKLHGVAQSDQLADELAARRDRLRTLRQVLEHEYWDHEPRAKEQRP